MLAELVPGMSKAEAHQMVAAFRRMMHGGTPPSDLDIGDLDTLEGVRDFPVRVKCAPLAWMTLDEALRLTEVGDNLSTGVTVTEEDP